MTTPLTTDAVLTRATLERLNVLTEAINRHRQVRWLVNGRTDSIASGVARAFTDINGYFLHDTDDVRDAYLWVSSMIEHFLPVRDVLGMIARGEFGTD